MQEEAGFEVRPYKLAAVLDRNKQTPMPPPRPYTLYRLFFLCEILSGEPTASLETAAVDFFPRDNLPPLAQHKVTTTQLERMFTHYQNPHIATDFD